MFSTGSGILVLGDVASVQCYDRPREGSVCEVMLRSGQAVRVDMKFSRSLLDAVQAYYADLDADLDESLSSLASPLVRPA